MKGIKKVWSLGICKGCILKFLLIQLYDRLIAIEKQAQFP